MNNELHIQIRPGVVEDPEDILENFPFEDGQSIISFAGDTIIINLGEAEDTTYVQDWYLNSNEDVMTFYVVGE